MGTIHTVFHISENFPVVRERLISLANGEAILPAVAFSLLMREKISSGVISYIDRSVQ